MLLEGFLTGAWGQNPWNSAGSWIKIPGMSAFGLVLCPSDRFYGEFFIFFIFFPSSIGNLPGVRHLGDARNQGMEGKGGKNGGKPSSSATHWNLAFQLPYWKCEIPSGDKNIWI